MILIVMVISGCSNDDAASTASPLVVGSSGAPVPSAIGNPTATALGASPEAVPSSSITTTTIAPISTVFDQACVRQVQEGDTLESIASTLKGSYPLRGLWYENGFLDTLVPGQLLDVCVDNGINDIEGGAQLRAAHPNAVAALKTVVSHQQTKVNELLGPYGMRPLTVDGIPGPSTGQRLCAVRLLLGLKRSINDMEPASTEMAALMAATGVSAPKSSVRGSSRWALIDKTCQVMFIGSGMDLKFVFPTSTGGEGTDTRPQTAARVFRYNPAVDNDGWHNSSQYPVGYDNPLNGNLYKPLFFDYGQAIHGAGSIPPRPASKGCARLAVDDQNRLINWLGLDKMTTETWVPKDINLVVAVQGTFIPRSS